MRRRRRNRTDTERDDAEALRPTRHVKVVVNLLWGLLVVVLGDNDSDDEADEMQSLLQWIWDFDSCGPSICEEYGHFCEAEVDDPTQWEWARQNHTKAGTTTRHW